MTPAKLKAARASVGLTQQQAGALIGVTRVTWARYELGISSMTAAQWQHWRHVAGIERIPFERRET